MDTPQNVFVMLEVLARNKGILAGTSWWHILVTVWTWIDLDAGESTWFWETSTLAGSGTGFSLPHRHRSCRIDLDPPGSAGKYGPKGSQWDVGRPQTPHQSFPPQPPESGGTLEHWDSNSLAPKLGSPTPFLTDGVNQFYFLKK